MASADVELEPQLKDVGKQLSHPLDSNDELLIVLDKLEKLLLKVDQSPKKSMLDALQPSINALVQDSLLKHSDSDVKVSVASCISEITRITAPDAPYTDDQMRDVFQLIVSSFEDFADRSSRSYNKRASILETVSKVRSCVIMLDLECDDLIVKMFEHFLKSVRDYHLDAVYSSMENIMLLVIEESEEISVELLKPLLASVKKDRVGVLPVAHKLGKEVLLKSADKLKPYMMPALTSLGESVDMYHKVVAAVCEGTTANFDNNDDNDTELQPANECKLEKDSVDDTPQVDESKVTTASSDHVDKVVKGEACSTEEVDSTVENRSPKAVMSNGVNVKVKEPEEASDSDHDKLAKDVSQTEKEADTVINSVEPSDSSHVEGDKEVEKDNDVKESEVEKENAKDDDDDNDVKESEVEKENAKDDDDDDVKESEVEKENAKDDDDDVKESEVENENEKDNDVKKSEVENQNEKDDDDVKESENQDEEDKDVKESKDQNEEDSDVKESENQNEKDKGVKESENETVIPSETEAVESKPVSQEVKTASPSKTGPPDKGLTQGDKPEDQKQEDKKTVIKKEVKLADTVKKSEDDEASGSDAKHQKQKGKKTIIEKEVKLADTVNKSEDDEASGSDAKPLKKTESKLKSTKQSGKKSKQSGKKSETPAKKGEKSKIAVEEDEEDDSDDKPLKLSAKKNTSKKKDDGKKRGTGTNVAEKDEAKSLSEDDEMDVSPKIAVEDDEEDDSDNKPLKLSAKKSTSRKKNDGKKRGNVKNVAEKDQAKSLSGDDEMDISPKSGEGNSSAKRKRSTGKDEVSDAIKYDESLVGKRVKVFWPEDKMYYEGLVTEFYPAKKRHKVSYVDGDEEKLNLRTQKWEILEESSVRDDEEQNTEVQSDEGSPEIHQKKKTKTDSAGKKSSSSKTKTFNKSKVKTPTTGSKSNTNGPTKAKSDVKEPEDVKSTENAKGGSKSGNKRKKRA